MDILIYLVPIAICLGLIGLLGFLWTVKTKQYEDLDGAASRILFDEEDGNK
jgi:cbb3-type cytochrome oxidase maturation protein